MSDWDALNAAAGSGDVAELERIAARSPELLTAPPREGVSPLMSALYRGKRESADFLISKGWPLDAFEAAAMGDVAALEHSLQASPTSLNALSADGFTALHFSVFFNENGAAEALLARRPELEIVSRNGLAVTPLQSALAARNVSGAQLLIAGGADVDARSSQGWPPLSYCAEYNLVEVARELLRRGADPSRTNPDGLTPLEHARKKGSAEVAALLEQALQPLVV